MRQVFFIVLFSLLATDVLPQSPSSRSTSVNDANEISYAAVRAAQLQQINSGDVKGLQEALHMWLYHDARGLVARVSTPELSTPDERVRALRVLRLIAAMHERHPIPQIAASPETLAGLEAAKAENPCEYALHQKRDWNKPLQSLSVEACSSSQRR